MNKNILLQKYSKTFKIDKENMSNFFVENYLTNFEEVFEEFQQIRNEVYSFLWNVSKKEQLTQENIEQLSRKFLSEKYSWIDEIGFNSLKDYIFWICWHEGIMKN